MVFPTVVKVGGSLYDWPEFGSRLRQWLNHPAHVQVLLIPGGGPMVDVVRDLDRRQGLGEEAAHWLALRALSVNAYFLANLLPTASVVETLEGCSQVWERRELAILDAHAFFSKAGERETGLPHSWDATSDSIAAHVARRICARRLFLLKSTDDPTHGKWSEASRQGFVDPWFAHAVGPDLVVEVVNLRRWPE